MLDKPRLGRAALRAGRITATADGARLGIAARLEQEDGFLTARATAGVHWKNRLLPAPDESFPIQGHLEAQHFQVAVFDAFTPASVRISDGVIDGKAVARVDAQGRTALEGALELRRGRVYLASLAQDLGIFGPTWPSTGADRFASRMYSRAD